MVKPADLGLGLVGDREPRIAKSLMRAAFGGSLSRLRRSLPDPAEGGKRWRPFLTVALYQALLDGRSGALG